MNKQSTHTHTHKTNKNPKSTKRAGVAKSMRLINYLQVNQSESPSSDDATLFQETTNVSLNSCC